jgi:hypothetical protein
MHGAGWVVGSMDPQCKVSLGSALPPTLHPVGPWVANPREAVRQVGGWPPAMHRVVGYGGL